MALNVQTFKVQTFKLKMKTTMKKSEIPRGIRNNNPLNIRRSKADWQGLVAPSSSPEGEKAPSNSPEGGENKAQASVSTHYDAEFCQFESMFYGFRAAFKLLFSYYYKHGLRTVKGIINRWAPSSDGNDCNVYSKFVLNYMCGKWPDGCEPNYILPAPEKGPYTWKLLVKAMAEMESTKVIRKYFDDNINEAYDDAIKSLKPREV